MSYIVGSFHFVLLPFPWHSVDFAIVLAFSPGNILKHMTSIKIPAEPCSVWFAL